ncbi:MAG TPA: DUF4349 domain-containing protein [Thermoanaerobaculia bacterium]|nr:DUF4349 domain-containing protein [Thermoanaerobaculia bacterium]
MRAPTPLWSPLAVLLAVLLLAIACQAERALDPALAGVAVEQAARQRAPASLQELGRAATAQDEAAAVAVPTARKLIRNGSLSLEVDAVPATVERVKARVEEAEGYVGNESEYQDAYGRKSASLTCRVPAERLDAVIADLRELGRVESVSIGAEDVTEQYFDLEIRLATQRELEGRLRELLRRPSNELSDLLEIERELARVRTEIDQMEGRKRFWDQQIAMSTLTVSLAEPRPKVAAGEGGVWRTLAASFRRAGENFVLAVAGIVSFTGGLVPVVLALWLAWILVRALRRRRRARAAYPVD